MENLLDTTSADELHQLQPLFDRGLWIFGHDYESLDFTSNREMSTVIKKLFKEEEVSRLKNRTERQHACTLQKIAQHFLETNRRKLAGSEMAMRTPRAKLEAAAAYFS